LSRECSFQHRNNRIIGPIYNPVIQFGTPKIKRNYTGTVLSLVQGASGENYFHWMMDVLPRIKIFLQHYKIKDIQYFYLPNLTESQMESLKFLKIDKSKIINSRHNKHISADKIIFTSHPWYTKGKFHDQSANLPRWSIFWIRNFFLKYRYKFKIKNKIFLDRSDSIYSHSQIINYENLKIFLLSLGFEIVKPSKLSFTKQIYTFWNAKVIIGAHGAAFTNILFCRPKTKIIEFRPYGHPGKNYQRIARVNRLQYKYIESEKKYLNHKGGDIFVDIKKLKKILI
jgi:capsular polysaccharide biosynthesis protein